MNQPPNAPPPGGFGGGYGPPPGGGGGGYGGPPGGGGYGGPPGGGGYGGPPPGGGGYGPPPGGYGGPPPPGGFGGPPGGFGGPPGAMMQHAPYGIDPVTGLPFSDKSKMAAGLLQIFFGYFGVGRFYTGHTGIAIAQILVSWFTCVGFLWPLIDGIMMLTGKVPDAQGRPLRD